MNTILIAALLFAAAFAVLTAVLIFRRIKKKKHNAGDIACIAAAVLMGAGSLITGYFSVYYHALPSAEKYLESTESLTVSEIDGGLLFDGPGTGDLLIFYPGAKVEYTSYAPLLNEIAGSGIDCCILEMPMNAAIFGIKSAEKILAEYSYDRYFIGGHSLGGACAAMYAADHPEKFSGIVLLGSYSTVEQPESLDVLLIYGENDGCLDMEHYKAGKELIRGKISEICIPGGNHAQFGDYGIQKGDGEASITPEQQRETAVTEICGFIEEK